MSAECYFIFVPRDDSEALMAELRGDGLPPQTGAPLFRGELGEIDSHWKIIPTPGLPHIPPTLKPSRPLPYPPRLKDSYAR